MDDGWCTPDFKRPCADRANVAGDLRTFVMVMKKLRLIQCGVGGMGKAWRDNATVASEDFEVVAIVDIKPETLNEAGEHLQVPTEDRFSSLKAAIGKVQADAVLTVTPPAIHVEHAKIAFAHGLHLLTE